MGLLKERDSNEKFCGQNMTEKSYNRMFWALLFIIVVFSSMGGVGESVFYWRILTLEYSREIFDW
jgi:hypothetical protein